MSAQTIMIFTLCDAQSRAPIPYANVGIIAASKGTVSDQNGRVSFSSDKSSALVTISSLGYEVIEFSATELSKIDTVFLNPKVYKIPDINVTAGRMKGESVILGLRNKKRGHSFGFASAQLGTEIGSAISIEQPTFVKTANFTINHAKGDSLLLRLNIYSYQDEIIGENILKEAIFIRDRQKKGTYTVDISHQNLVLENDVIFALEWLRDYDEVGNKDITFDTKKSKKLRGTFIRYSSNAPFQRFKHDKNHKPCFYFDGVQ